MLGSTAFQPAAFAQRALGLTRPVCLGLAIFWAIATIGLYRAADWATWIWPWDDARMTYVFLASVTAAIGAPLLWIAIVDEPAAAAGLAIDAICITSVMAVAFLVMALTQSDARLLVYAAGAAASTAIAWAIFQGSRGLGEREHQPLPRLVRTAFGVFVVLLFAVGIPLFLRVDNMFPWTLPGHTSTAIGAIFTGAAAYFVWGIYRNTWVHGGGQLAGLLAYAAVLLVPYWRTLLDKDGISGSGGYMSFPGQASAAGDEVNRSSLIGYTSVITIAAILAVYFLFIDRKTSIWRHLARGADASRID